MLRLTVLVVVLGACAGCGARELPPPEAPDTSLPPDVPYARQWDTLIVTSNGPARVLYGDPGGPPLCPSTPCIVRLPPGEHPITFQSLDDAHRKSSTRIRSTERPSTVKHTLGSYQGRGATTWVGIGVTSLGGVVTSAGILALGAGDLNAEKGDKQPDRTGPQVAIVLGLVAVTAGILMIAGNRPTHQKGSTVQWLAGGAPEPRP